MEYASKRLTNLNILLVGKTGNGKSSTGCTLLNDRKAFICGSTLKSVTKECKRKEFRYRDCNVSVVDTPGVFDTSVPHGTICEAISSSMLLSPDGYHVILIIIKYGSRFTPEEAQAIVHMENMFGIDLFRFAIIVVTHADEYYRQQKRYPQTTQNQDDYLMNSQVEEFQQLFKKCGERFVFCDNLSRDLEYERRKLLDGIHELVAQNDGELFTNELFLAVKETLLSNAQEEDGTGAAEGKKVTIDEEKLNRLFESLSEKKQETVVKEVTHIIEKHYEKDKACFPKDATCNLETGEVLKMEHLQQGDKVQVVLPDGTLDYQEVFMFSHADPNTETSFLVFTTENQRQLSNSPGHYLYVKGQDGKMAMVPARNVQVDDALYTYLPENGTMELSAVTKIKMKTLQGLYNPHTKSGTIIVNGVMASCYTEAFSPVWAHRLLQPVWFLYKMAPWINRIVAKDGMPVWLSFLDIGKSLWEKMRLSVWQ